jgi:hypothetical protein
MLVSYKYTAFDEDEAEDEDGDKEMQDEDGSPKPLKFIVKTDKEGV